MGSILFTADRSEYARTAAAQAVELAEERDATLHVRCVGDERRFDEPGLSSAELATIYADDHATLSVSEVADMAVGSDVVVEGDTKHGIPYEVLLEVADEGDAGVIVIGEHGDHGEHFAGVGQKVRELANRDVFVVEAES